LGMRVTVIDGVILMIEALNKLSSAFEIRTGARSSILKGLRIDTEGLKESSAEAALLLKNFVEQTEAKGTGLERAFNRVGRGVKALAEEAGIDLDTIVPKIEALIDNMSGLGTAVDGASVKEEELKKQTEALKAAMEDLNASTDGAKEGTEQLDGAGAKTSSTMGNLRGALESANTAASQWGTQISNQARAASSSIESAVRSMISQLHRLTKKYDEVSTAAAGISGGGGGGGGGSVPGSIEDQYGSTREFFDSVNNPTKAEIVIDGERLAAIVVRHMPGVVRSKIGERFR